MSPQTHLVDARTLIAVAPDMATALRFFFFWPPVYWGPGDGPGDTSALQLPPKLDLKEESERQTCSVVPQQQT